MGLSATTPGNTNAWIALVISAVGGGALSQAMSLTAKAGRNRRKDHVDERASLTQEESNLRADLRGQLSEMRTQLDQRLKEQDSWRQQYYESVAQLLTVNVKWERLQADHDELKREYEELRLEHSELERKYAQLHMAYDSLLERTEALARKFDEWLGGNQKLIQ